MKKLDLTSLILGVRAVADGPTKLSQQPCAVCAQPMSTTCEALLTHDVYLSVDGGHVLTTFRTCVGLHHAGCHAKAMPPRPTRSWDALEIGAAMVMVRDLDRDQ
jgi:hypothetical protein